MIRVPLSLLAAALPGARLAGRPDVVVRRISADSRDIRPGDLFAAVRGRHVDGHRYAAGAIQRGAVAVLLDHDVPGLSPFDLGIVRVPDVAGALAVIAPAFYNQPSLNLRVVGVTGTNGKTTITYLLRSIFDCCREGRFPAHRVGIVGTIRHEIAGRPVVSRNTTPFSWDLQRLLADMVEQDCDLALLEVSSHALAEERVRQIEFDAAVFTNLTREHLDFHRTMDRYAAAKRRLFTQLAAPGRKPGPKHAVINADDPCGERMARAAQGARIWRYALKRAAEVTAREVHLSPQGSRFVLVSPKGRVRIRLPLVGRHNVYNALASAATAQALGATLEDIRKGLERFPGVPGRLERVSGIRTRTVLVDYAHTPDALRQVLGALRDVSPRRLLLVVGAGGDRDPGKRAPMGELAARLADTAVITSDNPRSEDPLEIIRQIVAGVPASRAKHVRVEPDRRRAIRLALELSGPGDIVLLAGKGHETDQILRERTIPFDDKKIALREWVRRPARRRGSKRG